MESPEHNPGEPEFGEHDDDAAHNPGEPSFEPGEEEGQEPDQGEEEGS
jgi:hypothetical protein